MGAQVSSQRKIKKVKQALGKREQATLPQRSIVTTGNSFSRLNKLIYQNDLTFGNFREKRQPRALQLYLLGVREMAIRSTLLTSTRKRVMQALTELKLVAQVKHSFFVHNVFRQYLDTCKGDTKH